ncbi:uncharacterized protein At3g28850-like [Nicotiana tomentosiformis]|uniref:uncharacterized protein At3g28850-like n=1 Tax=Nicotiana tomentosiformis TaxID=4098 RepID=UPI00051CAA2D|nr:uncharacterized protein At3g28850-like [Nicotiana tomentosiformis]
MGCSASRSYDFVTKDPQNPSNSFSSIHSPYSYSDSSSTPVSRTLSLPTPLVHHPPLCKGDTNHLVSLISSTYGYGSLDPQVPDNTTCLMKCHNEGDPQDLLSPDSVINTWELMEGLDDLDFRMVQSHVEESSSPRKFKGSSNTHDMKPLWKHLSEESLLAKMDPNVASSYRKALSSKQFEHQESKMVRSVDRPLSSFLLNSDFYLKGTEDRIVLYYTSLRGIRKTHEDCCSMRMIFKEYRVCIDERDISMDSSYRKELQDVLEGKTMSLPRVFVRGKYIGGIEEIKQLHETGELAKLLEGFSVRNDGFTCESCGEERFVPCPGCNGSRKLFEKEEGKSRRCPRCNENGLIRCPGCYP